MYQICHCGTVTFWTTENTREASATMILWCWAAKADNKTMEEVLNVVDWSIIILDLWKTLLGKASKAIVKRWAVQVFTAVLSVITSALNDCRAVTCILYHLWCPNPESLNSRSFTLLDQVRSWWLCVRLSPLRQYARNLVPGEKSLWNMRIPRRLLPINNNRNLILPIPSTISLLRVMPNWSAANLAWWLLELHRNWVSCMQL